MFIKDKIAGDAQATKSSKVTPKRLILVPGRKALDRTAPGNVKEKKTMIPITIP
jgi:hypothetical protein